MLPISLLESLASCRLFLLVCFYFHWLFVFREAHLTLLFFPLFLKQYQGWKFVCSPSFSPLLLEALMSLWWMSWSWTTPDCSIAIIAMLPNISYNIPFCSLSPGLHLFVSCSRVKDQAQTLTAVPPGHSSYPANWCLCTLYHNTVEASAGKHQDYI